MDSDQEVTREPFEDESHEEADSNDDGSPIHSDVEGSNSLREHEQEEDICESNTDSEEDINYARSFGIDLKHSKSSKSYESLLNSKCFKQTIPNETKPVIETSFTSDCIYHKGTFYQKGDIVVMCDQEDGLTYFAQIRGFLQDQFCEKSASVNWLVPTRPTSRDSFDPSAYKIGLEDSQLRRLDCMTFVRHCPHDYFTRKFFHDCSDEQGYSHDEESMTTSYPEKSKSQAYIWTSMKPSKVPKIGML